MKVCQGKLVSALDEPTIKWTPIGLHLRHRIDRGGLHLLGAGRLEGPP